MYMYFWWGCKLTNFLFYGYDIKSAGILVLTCFGVAALGFTFEWLKLLEARFRQKELFLRARQLKSICPSESSTLLGENREAESVITLKQRVLLFCHEFILWFSVQNLGYLLMLCAMLYNGWLFIAVIIGGGLGYFVFGQTFMKINLQNCQVIRDTYCMLNCAEPGPSRPENDGESTPAIAHQSCHGEASVNVHVQSGSSAGDS